MTTRKLPDPDDQSGEYVPLSEYQEVVNLVNELGEKDVQSRLQIDKLKAIIHRVIEIGPSLHAGSIADVIYGKTANAEKLIQLLEDCEAVAFDLQPAGPLAYSTTEA